MIWRGKINLKNNRKKEKCFRTIKRNGNFHTTAFEFLNLNFEYFEKEAAQYDHALVLWRVALGYINAVTMGHVTWENPRAQPGANA